MCLVRHANLGLTFQLIEKRNTTFCLLADECLGLALFSKFAEFVQLSGKQRCRETMDVFLKIKPLPVALIHVIFGQTAKNVRRFQ